MITDSPLRTAHPTGRNAVTITRFAPITDPNFAEGVAGIVRDALRADCVDVARWKVSAVHDPTDLTRVALFVNADHAGIAETALRALGFTVDHGAPTFYLGQLVTTLYVREPVIGHDHACDLLYRFLDRDDTAMAGALKAVLAIHHAQPGPGQPVPGCTFCAGTGRAPDGEHCHCACGVCVGCGDPLCEGPCETIAELGAWLTPHDLSATIALEDQHEDAGRLAADDRRTCHTHRQWATDCAHRHSDPVPFPIGLLDK